MPRKGRINPAAPPPLTIGTILRQETKRDRAVHLYTLIEVRPHVTLDGGASAVLTWQGHCVVCGHKFTCTTGPTIGQHLTRSCPLHRPPRRHASFGVLTYPNGEIVRLDASKGNLSATGGSRKGRG
jgi:hypothetical protein